MTGLSGDLKISKADDRIAFRGLIDSLEALVIEGQVLASERGEDQICSNLGEVLGYLRMIMSAEVNDTPLPPLFLFGMDAEEIRKESHKAFVLPDYALGPVAARINLIRAKVREVELHAVKVFGSESLNRDDIIVGLNRLSSALWCLFTGYNARR